MRWLILAHIFICTWVYLGTTCLTSCQFSVWAPVRAIVLISPSCNTRSSSLGLLMWKHEKVSSYIAPTGKTMEQRAQAATSCARTTLMGWPCAPTSMMPGSSRCELIPSLIPSVPLSACCCYLRFIGDYSLVCIFSTGLNYSSWLGACCCAVCDRACLLRWVRAYLLRGTSELEPF